MGGMPGPEWVVVELLPDKGQRSLLVLSDRADAIAAELRALGRRVEAVERAA